MGKNKINKLTLPDFLKSHFNIGNIEAAKPSVKTPVVRKNEQKNGKQIKSIKTKKNEYIIDFKDDINPKKNKLKAVLKDKRFIKNNDIESEYIADWLVRFNKLVQEFEELTIEKEEISDKKISEMIKKSLHRINSSSFVIRASGYCLAVLAVSISLVYFAPQFTRSFVSTIDSIIANPIIKLVELNTNNNFETNNIPVQKEIKEVKKFTSEELSNYIKKNQEKIKKETESGNNAIDINEDDINGRVAGETE